MSVSFLISTMNNENGVYKMSSTAYAYAIVGIRLELANDMFGESRQSSCIHRFDIDTCNFCPQ